MGGCEVSVDLSASGARNPIMPTSCTGPTTRSTSGDAKHAGGDAERKGKKEVENKVKYLQEQLKASGDKRVAKVGFDFPPGVVPKCKAERNGQDLAVTDLSGRNCIRY